jgi:hypothetical protein
MSGTNLQSTASTIGSGMSAQNTASSSLPIPVLIIIILVVLALFIGFIIYIRDGNRKKLQYENIRNKKNEM